MQLGALRVEVEGGDTDGEGGVDAGGGGGAGGGLSGYATERGGTEEVVGANEIVGVPLRWGMLGNGTDFGGMVSLPCLLVLLERG